MNEMEQSWLNGFMAKCAEANLDGRKVIEHINGNTKRAQLGPQNRYDIPDDAGQGINDFITGGGLAGPAVGAAGRNIKDFIMDGGLLGKLVGGGDDYEPSAIGDMAMDEAGNQAVGQPVQGGSDYSPGVVGIMGINDASDRAMDSLNMPEGVQTGEVPEDSSAIADLVAKLKGWGGDAAEWAGDNPVPTGLAAGGLGTLALSRMLDGGDDDDEEEERYQY